MTEITNALIKQIKSLARARDRRCCGLFKVEGHKAVADTLPYFHTQLIAATEAWIAANPAYAGMAVKASPRQIERMTSLTTPPDVIAVYTLPEIPEADIACVAASELVLALDTIQDPGNLGTILRTAAWFGIRHIWASEETVDVFSPKVVQSTMGAIAAVDIHYCDLPAALARVRGKGVPVYGTFLDGHSVFAATLSSTGVIVVGNEGKGISAPVAAHVSHRLTIPAFPTESSYTPESLNAAIATAVVVAQFRSHGKN